MVSKKSHQQLMRGRGRHLFGNAAAAALAFGDDGNIAQIATDFKTRFVGIARLGNHGVARQGLFFVL